MFPRYANIIVNLTYLVGQWTCTDNTVKDRSDVEGPRCRSRHLAIWGSGSDKKCDNMRNIQTQ